MAARNSQSARGLGGVRSHGPCLEPGRGNPTNLFDDITGNLSTIANHQHLDRITLIDQATGAVLAEYERAGAVWTRTR